MQFFLNIAHGYHQDLLMKKEGWKGSDKPTAIKETTFGKMNDKLPFGKNCKQIWLPNGCLLEQGDAFSCGFFAAAVNLLPFLEFYADPVNDCNFLREDFQAKNGLVVATKAEKYNCKMFWVNKFGEKLDPTELSKKL